MNETTAVDMNATCAHCGKPKFQCLCGCTNNIKEWRKTISPTTDVSPQSKEETKEAG